MAPKPTKKSNGNSYQRDLGVWINNEPSSIEQSTACARCIEMKFTDCKIHPDPKLTRCGNCTRDHQDRLTCHFEPVSNLETTSSKHNEIISSPEITSNKNKRSYSETEADNSESDFEINTKSVRKSPRNRNKRMKYVIDDSEDDTEKDLEITAFTRVLSLSVDPEPTVRHTMRSGSVISIPSTPEPTHREPSMELDLASHSAPEPNNTQVEMDIDVVSIPKPIYKGFDIRMIRGKAPDFNPATVADEHWQKRHKLAAVEAEAYKNVMAAQMNLRHAVHNTSGLRNAEDSEMLTRAVAEFEQEFFNSSTNLELALNHLDSSMNDHAAACGEHTETLTQKLRDAEYEIDILQTNNNNLVSENNKLQEKIDLLSIHLARTLRNKFELKGELLIPGNNNFGIDPLGNKVDFPLRSVSNEQLTVTPSQPPTESNAQNDDDPSVE
jgi:hypothetical protein